MKTAYYALGGGIVLGALAIIAWYKRDRVTQTFRNAPINIKNATRSAYGRVARAADVLVHTEKAPGDATSTN